MKIMDIKITKATTLKEVPEDYSKLAFGKQFTDHMLTMEYKDGAWQPAEIKPYGNIVMDPAASCLHYGQEIFEGMKAYLSPDGKIQLFRPRNNFERMNSSAERMCMKTFDVDYVLNALKELLKIEKRWIPKERGTALYIRPTMVASEPFLGVHPAEEFLFFVILSPVGSYFKDGFKPVKIMVEDEYVRAVKGGVGNAKTAGNYAASLLAGQKAEHKGYSQVLWLDGVHHKYIEEVGAMNMAFVINDTIITPKLGGSILPGITRDSVINISPKLGLKIEVRDIAIDEILSALEKNELQEAFGMGTAAVIAPVGLIAYKDNEYTINNYEVGSISQKLFNEITGIQYGINEDIMNWTEQFE